MRKSPEKISTTSKATKPKDQLEESLNRIVSQKRIDINFKLKKTFHSLINSDIKQKLDSLRDDDKDDSVNLFLLSVISDLLEKKDNVQNELFQITEAYEDVVGLITHEFKNILTSVHGYNMMMEREVEALDNQNLMEILKSSDRLTHQLFDMSDSLLKMSLGEKGLLNPEYKLINFVEDLYGPILKDIQGTLKDKNMKTVINQPSGDIIIEGDDGLLDIVMRNLLINAIRYGKNGSDIIVSIERVKKDCKLMVRNECEKIPKNFCNNIFQKFTKKKVGTVKGGTGLGLYNVKKIIDLHHGTVKCMVKNKRWIEFEIILPQNII